MQGCGGDLDILLGARVPAWAAFAQPAGQAMVFAWLIQCARLMDSWGDGDSQTGAKGWLIK
mgnify:CR=1 FL=1